ncbi:MAG: 4'-phosphopantetheinyl transferase superfamily protein [Bacteroidota bacterium]
MKLPPDIRRLHLTYDPAADYVSLLSKEETAVLETYAHPKRRREFVLGRAAARHLLGRHLGLEPADVPLRIADDGAVDVIGHGVYLSISHAPPFAVAVVAPRPIGADLEQIQTRREDLYTFVLDPSEYEAFNAWPLSHQEGQVLAWTVKEAVLKGLRTGFRMSPKKLRLAIDVEAGAGTVEVEGQTPWAVWFEREQNHFFAVAVPA